ncbi:hypothetical protein EYF80_005631 [Liparis tanakae]|uniref:Uncharacterized protein n=1 Tax=Liparis tanakae TaxID=230148 RepID=A0A4Z2J382_9TELE|nr:hypothetical protein EYF80_005631 [Liparis tanakae]
MRREQKRTERKRAACGETSLLGMMSMYKKCRVNNYKPILREKEQNSGLDPGSPPLGAYSHNAPSCEVWENLTLFTIHTRRWAAITSHVPAFTCTGSQRERDTVLNIPGSFTRVFIKQVMLSFQLKSMRPTSTQDSSNQLTATLLHHHQCLDSMESREERRDLSHRSHVDDDFIRSEFFACQRDEDGHSQLLTADQPRSGFDLKSAAQAGGGEFLFHQPQAERSLTGADRTAGGPRETQENPGIRCKGVDRYLLVRCSLVPLAQQVILSPHSRSAIRDGGEARIPSPLELFPWESQCGMWPWAVVEPETQEQQDGLIDNISQLVWQHLEILQEELGGCSF